MTDTTNLPHSRACGINCNGHGAACSKDCPTCAGRPDWTPGDPLGIDAAVARPFDTKVLAGSGRVRATIAVERLERLAADAFRTVEWDSPATPDQLADVLEALHGFVLDLQQRASSAETERDAYREAIAGGRALLGMVLDVPVVVDHEPAACRADQFCEATAHYIACPSYTADKPSAGPGCWAPGCALGGGHPGQHHPWHHDQAAYDRACRAHHPGELCKPGENHPGAN